MTAIEKHRVRVGIHANCTQTAAIDRLRARALRLRLSRLGALLVPPEPHSALDEFAALETAVIVDKIKREEIL